MTLLFTNDLESAYDPTTAWWRDDMARIGGLPQLATMIERRRQPGGAVFLFDAGDIFTGTLARRTRGAIAFDLMRTMGYDAMAIGNHEFEYGAQTFAEQKHRAPFPVLSANLRYRDSGRYYAQPYAIVERAGVRIGVIGLLGQDAATALIPAHIEALSVEDPAAAARPLVAQLRREVDLVVVLVHQGPTAPMQTNDEADPSVHRGNLENLALAGAVPGIDVILAGHTDAGTREPLVHPETGTLIMQTFGQGQHLGVLELEFPRKHGQPMRHRGQLLPVDADATPPDPRIERTLARYRAQHPDLYEVIGHSEQDIARRYYTESDLGNLFADIVREAAGADIGLMPSGALRKDLPAGPLRRVDMLDAFPFEDRIASVNVRGILLRRILEQGLSLERGMLQVSGLQLRYDPTRPVGQRLGDVTVNGEPLQDDAQYSLGTVEIVAQGGDAYTQFHDAAPPQLHAERFAEALEAYVLNTPRLRAPRGERLLPQPAKSTDL